MELFYTKFIGLINQLKSHGENIEDKRIVENFIRSLPPKLESLVVTLEENKDLWTNLPLMSYKPHSSIMNIESVNQIYH